MANGAGIRLAGYDYSTPNRYFITVAIEGRRPLLGEVRSIGFVPSRLGELVLTSWNETLHVRPWISVDSMQLMPDHVHAIIGWDTAPTDRPATLGAFIGQFKGRASHHAHAAEMLPTWDRVWQSGFWDRVIRNEQELERIRAYIVRNPLKLLLRQQQVAAEARQRALRKPLP